MISLESIMTIMFMNIVSPLMAAATKSLTDAINKLVDYIIKPRPETPVIDDYNYVTISSIYSSAATNQFPFTSSSGNDNTHLIKSVLQYISPNIILSKKTSYNIGEGNKNLIGDDYCRSQVFTIIPEHNVEYDGFIISYNQNTTLNKNDTPCTNFSLVIKSKRSTKDINEFIRKCYDTFISNQSIEASASYTKNYIYKCERLSPDCTVEYSRYTLKNRITFNDIFIPNLNKIINLATKFKNGEIGKLSLLLHGVPGCGKTSIIKALANYLEFSVIEVKLSLFNSDVAFTKLFNDDHLCYSKYDRHGSQRCYSYVPINKRIYVLEDIDAECDITHKRSEINVESFGNDKDDEKKPKLTLAGILNTFDGIQELNTVMVMTTNHVAKLDPALIRSGRVTKAIELKKMTSQDASLLIAKYFGSHNIHVDDYTIIPADLDALCQSADSIDDVRLEIGNLIA